MTTFFSIALLFMQAVVLPAERGTLTLQGDVRDSSRAVMPGARVSVKSAKSKLPRRVLTDESGRYVFSGLLPGEYELVASIPGFTRTPRTITLTASTHIDFELKVSMVNSGPGVSADYEGSPTPDPRRVRALQDAEDAAAELWRLTLRIEDLERAPRTSERSYQAIREFYFFGGDAVPALVLALQDEDVQVRRNAAVILAYFAAPPAGQASVDILEALPTLRERLQDADAEVRQVALRVIQAIEGTR